LTSTKLSIAEKILELLSCHFHFCFGQKRRDHLCRRTNKRAYCTLALFNIYWRKFWREKEGKKLAGLLCHFTMDFFCLIFVSCLTFGSWTFFAASTLRKEKKKEWRDVNLKNERMHENHKNQKKKIYNI
jgi:hypothetical protein